MVVTIEMILQEIVANQQRLDGCQRHHFPTWPANIPVALGAKVDCSKCGGTICALQAAAYARGYGAAGGNPNDIIPGWS